MTARPTTPIASSSSVIVSNSKATGEMASTTTTTTSPSVVLNPAQISVRCGVSAPISSTPLQPLQAASPPSIRTLAYDIRERLIGRFIGDFLGFFREYIEMIINGGDSLEDVHPMLLNYLDNITKMGGP